MYIQRLTKNLIWTFLYRVVNTDRTNLATDCHRLVKDAVHAQNGRLRWVDDGRPEQGAKHAAVADGESSSVHVLHCQLIFTSLPETHTFTVTTETNHFSRNGQSEGEQQEREHCFNLFFSPFRPVH